MNTGLSVHGIYKIKIIPQRVVPIKVFIHDIADTGSCRYRQTMKPKACSLYLVCTLQSLCVMDGYTKTAKVKRSQHTLTPCVQHRSYMVVVIMTSEYASEYSSFVDLIHFGLDMKYHLAYG